MRNDLVNLRKIEKMANFVLKNGLRLHNDSITLFNKKCYPSAFFISVLALEEIGKFFLIEDFWWHSQVDGRMEKEWEERFIKSIYFHRTKQNSFAYNMYGPVATSKFAKELFNGDIETKKQNAVYVGFPRDKREINLKGKINNPINISRIKASNQITNINDKIIEFTLGVVKKVYCVETNQAEKALNKKLYEKLRKIWSITNLLTNRRLKRLEKV